MQKQKGYYISALIEIAQKTGCRLSVPLCIKKGIEKKCIFFDENDLSNSKNFKVLKAVKFLEVLTKKKWMKTVMFHKETPFHENEFLVYKYQQIDNSTKKVSSIFTVGTIETERNARAVKSGKIKKTIIFTVFD